MFIDMHMHMKMILIPVIPENWIFSTLQFHMIFQNHSNMLIWCLIIICA